jgi:uncharacterized membrane protein YczE
MGADVDVGVASVDVVMCTWVWVGWVWVGIGAVVMGVDSMIMCTVGVGTGGMDTLVSKIISAASKVSCCDPRQICL